MAVRGSSARLARRVGQCPGILVPPATSEPNVLSRAWNLPHPVTSPGQSPPVLDHRYPADDHVRCASRRGDHVTHGKHDRSTRRTELNEIAQELAQYYGRFAEPVVDVEHWVDTHEHRHVGALLVVWDRADAAVLEHRRPDVEVHTAAPLLGWLRQRRQRRITRPDDIAGPAKNSDDPPSRD